MKDAPLDRTPGLRPPSDPQTKGAMTDEAGLETHSIPHQGVEPAYTYSRRSEFLQENPHLVARAGMADELRSRVDVALLDLTRWEAAQVAPPLNPHTPNASRAQLYQGDCRRVLPRIAPDSVDLIITSPPYADQRKAAYGGVHADDYVQWFLPVADGLQRVLKPTGSFVLNIKERVVDGERHTYVMELIIEMRKRGWRFTEEYVWHKRNSYPGKWPNRFRDAWERCIHFTREKHFAMYQDEVRVPMGDWKNARLKSLSATDRVRDESKVGSGFGKKIENWVGRDLAYPTNVLHLATECGNRSHAAAFPDALPEWFIRLFTRPGDTVLDPFSGSGTTMRVAHAMGRDAIGIELQAGYCALTVNELGLVSQDADVYVSP